MRVSVCWRGFFLFFLFASLERKNVIMAAEKALRVQHRFNFSYRPDLTGQDNALIDLSSLAEASVCLSVCPETIR